MAKGKKSAAPVASSNWKKLLPVSILSLYGSNQHIDLHF